MKKNIAMFACLIALVLSQIACGQDLVKDMQDANNNMPTIGITNAPDNNSGSNGATGLWNVMDQIQASDCNNNAAYCK